MRESDDSLVGNAVKTLSASAAFMNGNSNGDADANIACLTYTIKEQITVSLEAWVRRLLREHNYRKGWRRLDFNKLRCDRK